MKVCFAFGHSLIDMALGEFFNVQGYRKCTNSMTISNFWKFFPTSIYSK